MIATQMFRGVIDPPRTRQIFKRFDGNYSPKSLKMPVPENLKHRRPDKIRGSLLRQQAK